MKDSNQTSTYTPPSQDQIEQWKAKYPEGVFCVDIEDKQCWLKFPDIKILNLALTSLRKEGNMAFNKAIINNCWLEGNNEIKTIDSYYFSLCDQISEVIEIPEVSISREGSKNIIKINEFSCVLRSPSRDELAKSTKNNKNPLDGQIKLIKDIWEEGDTILTQRPDLYAALLSCSDNLIEAKTASIKKY